MEADRPKRLGWCREACKHFDIEAHCCSSCHEDADHYGFDLIEMNVGIPYASDYFLVCCAVANTHEENEKRKAEHGS